MSDSEGAVYSALAGAGTAAGLGARRALRMGEHVGLRTNRAER
jgi:hypothetical protein